MRVWVPQKRPPDASHISGMSADAEVVRQALLWKYQETLLRAQTQHQRPDPRGYYESLYQRQYGVSPIQAVLDPYRLQSDIASTPRLLNLGTPLAGNTPVLHSRQINQPPFPYSRLYQAPGEGAAAAVHQDVGPRYWDNTGMHSPIHRDDSSVSDYLSNLGDLSFGGSSQGSTSCQVVDDYSQFQQTTGDHSPPLDLSPVSPQTFNRKVESKPHVASIHSELVKEPERDYGFHHPVDGSSETVPVRDFGLHHPIRRRPEITSDKAFGMCYSTKSRSETDIKCSPTVGYELSRSQLDFNLGKAGNTSHDDGKFLIIPKYGHLTQHNEEREFSVRQPLVRSRSELNNISSSCENETFPHDVQSLLSVYNSSVEKAPVDICHEDNNTTFASARVHMSATDSKLRQIKSMRERYIESRERASKNDCNLKGETCEPPLKKNKGARQKKFSVPFKGDANKAQHKQGGMCVPHKDDPSKSQKHQTEEKEIPGRLVHTDTVGGTERIAIKREVSEAKEVAMTLVYDHRHSQLHPAPPERKGACQNPGKVTGVALAYPSKQTSGSDSLQLRFILLNMQSKEEHYKVWCRDLLGGLLSSPTRKLCYDGQELMYMVITAYRFQHSEVVLKWQCVDPKVACWLLNPDRPPGKFAHVLSYLKDLKLSEQGSPEERLCDDLALLGPAIMQLYQQLKQQQLWSLFSQQEMQLQPILAVMQLRGLRVNKDCFLKYAQTLKSKLSSLEKQAHKEAGHAFLISSHAQLRQVLFEELRLDLQLAGKKKIARTSVNNYKSTSESVLMQLQDLHPLPKIVLEYRQLQKLKSTYIDGMLDCVEGEHIFTYWDQTSAATGRLASAIPNLQAVPKQPVSFTLDSQIVGKEGETVDIYARQGFISREGYTFVAADFQQIELRILAHLTADKTLLRMFNDPDCQDVFISLTSQWLSKPAKEVTQADREQTKRIVYSVMYGAGKEKLAEYLQMTLENAKAIMQSFLVAFPCIRQFTNKCIDQAREYGYQTTIMKRRRWVPNINNPSAVLRAQAERQAVNFCVQGSAADLCKAAMIEVEHAVVEQDSIDARLMVQIHDELVIEVKETQLNELTELILDIMESGDRLCKDAVKLKVPLKVSITYGKNWAHMSPYSTMGNEKTDGRQDQDNLE